jgi:hypothetical protein
MNMDGGHGSVVAVETLEYWVACFTGQGALVDVKVFSTDIELLVFTALNEINTGSIDVLLLVRVEFSSLLKRRSAKCLS